MKTIRHIVLALVLSAELAAAGSTIEFSADLKEFMGEGVGYHRLTFTDDKRTIFYQPPPKWTCSLMGKSLHLRPTDANFAAAEIEAIPLAGPQSIDAAASEAFTQQVLSTLPPGSQQAEVVKQEQNPVPLNNNPTFEVIVSYKAIGDPFQRSVLFLNTPANQVVFKLTAKKADFDALYRAFRRSIATWEWQ